MTKPSLFPEEVEEVEPCLLGGGARAPAGKLPLLLAGLLGGGAGAALFDRGCSDTGSRVRDPLTRFCNTELKFRA